MSASCPPSSSGLHFQGAHVGLPEVAHAKRVDQGTSKGFLARGSCFVWCLPSSSFPCTIGPGFCTTKGMPGHGANVQMNMEARGTIRQLTETKGGTLAKMRPLLASPASCSGVRKASWHQSPPTAECPGNSGHEGLSCLSLIPIAHPNPYVITEQCPAKRFIWACLHDEMQGSIREYQRMAHRAKGQGPAVLDASP